MPSFDVVSEVDLQEVRNAIANANRELTSRWDFRQVYTRIELNEKSETITASTESDFQLRQLLDILCGHLVKRGIDSQALEIPEQVERSGKFFSVEITLKQGIDTPLAKKIVKLIKESTLKVQAQIQEKQVRITGKSRDSLQQSIALIRNNDLGQPFQFTNFRD